MKQIVILLCLVNTILSSCKKYPDPSYIILTNYNYRIFGSFQKGFSGEYLNDSIEIQIEDLRLHKFIAGSKVEFKVTTGGGVVDHYILQTDSSGRAYTYWKLGTESALQTLEINVYDSLGVLLNTAEVQAYALFKNQWNKITTYPEKNFEDIVVDTIHHLTFITTYNSLYYQKQSFYEWEQIGMLDMLYPRHIEINKEGVLYIGTWQAKIYKSSDMGLTWTFCSRPDSFHNTFVNPWITSDDYIWLSTNNFQLLCSRDGGNTWSADTIGLSSTDKLGSIYRLKDGTILYQSENRKLYKSETDGKSWQLINNAPTRIEKLYITADEDVIVCCSNAQFEIYKSSDKGAHFTKKFSVFPDFWTSFKNVFSKKGNIYYIMVPGKGVYATSNFETFDLFYEYPAIANLFIDYKGNFIVNDYLNSEAYYYPPSN